LVVLWVRSYRHVDNLYIRVAGVRTLNINSGLGKLAFILQAPGIGAWPHARNWHFVTQPAAPIRESLAKRGFVHPTLKFMRLADSSIFYIKFWIPVLVTGFVAAALAIRRPYRFSLRTLLIATTLIALFLGTIVLLSGQ
jgi:hypothetical protein